MKWTIISTFYCFRFARILSLLRSIFGFLDEPVSFITIFPINMGYVNYSWCYESEFHTYVSVFVCRRIPFMIALKKKHGRCATLLNPSSPGPLVWPSPLKFISELDQEAKLLLEAALMEANREREKSILKGAAYSVQSPIHSDDGTDDNVSEVFHSPLHKVTINIIEHVSSGCYPWALIQSSSLTSVRKLLE